MHTPHGYCIYISICSSKYAAIDDDPFLSFVLRRLLARAEAHYSLQWIELIGMVNKNTAIVMLLGVAKLFVA